MATVPLGSLGPQAACQGKVKWQSLGTSRQELTLDFTLPTGQSFRWRRSGEAEYTGVLNQRLVRTLNLLQQSPSPANTICLSSAKFLATEAV